jgi:hypothetical protein
MPKVGDVVRYSIQGKSYNALVLHAHSGQVDSLGEDDEPLVHLAFVAPERESVSARAKLGYIPQLFIEYDVVHASHEFSDQFKRENNLQTPAQIATKRGAGEWEDFGDAPVTWPTGNAEPLTAVPDRYGVSMDETGTADDDSPDSASDDKEN